MLSWWVKVPWRQWHEVVARPRDFDDFPWRGQQLLPEHKVYSWNFLLAARASGHPNQVLWTIQYLFISIQNQQIHTSISYPQVAIRNTAAKMFLTALHFASNVSAPIRTLLNQKQENWLTTSSNGVIRNRQFHLSLREHYNRTEKTYFLIGLNLSRAFSPSCWRITQTYQKWGIQSTNTDPSLSPLALWARSSQKDRPWPTEDPRVCGFFLYMPSSNQTCVMMNHLGRHDRAAKQDAKPAKW